MAEIVGNNIYVAIKKGSAAAVNVSSYFTNQVQFTPSASLAEYVIGSGTKDQKRAPGIEDTQLVIDMYHDRAQWSSIRQLFQPNVVLTVTYGMDGNGSGRPKFEGSMIIQQAPHSVSVTPNLVMHSLTFMQAAAPTSNIFEDTF